MTILTYEKYETMKKRFLHKHNDWKVQTSPMNQYGQYYKDYICDNGDVMTEVNTPVWKTIFADFHGTKVCCEIKMLESELYSNKFKSVYTYEQVYDTYANGRLVDSNQKQR